jgi:hypothetical protein
MASTRSINTAGNYELEMRGLKKQELYRANVVSQKADSPQFAGNGLLHGRHAHSELSQNFTDVENFLFGIRANDLTAHAPSQTMQCVPEIYMMQSLNIAPRGGMSAAELAREVDGGSVSGILTKQFGEPARYTF